MQVIFPKNGKHFVQALRVISSAARAAWIYIEPESETPLTLEVMSDNKVYYHKLRVHKNDLQIKGAHIRDVRFAAELKSLVASMREVTALIDMIVIEIGDLDVSHKVHVVTKTKKAETHTDVSTVDLLEIILDTHPEAMWLKGTQEMDCRELDTTFKGIPGGFIQVRCRTDGMVWSAPNTNTNTGESNSDNNSSSSSSNNSDSVKPKKYMTYKLEFLDHCCRPTLAKKVKVSVYKDYPIAFEYKLLSASYLTIFTVPYGLLL